MTKNAERSRLDQRVRRAALIDGLPVVVLGGVALALGSDPDSEQEPLWLAVTVLFIVSVAWALLRAFGRADEYQRKVQVESMAISFGVVMVALQIAQVLDASGIGALRQYVPLIVIGGISLWLLVADLRTRFTR